MREAGSRRRAARFADAGCSLLFISFRDRATVSAPFQGRASATAKDRTSTSASSWRGIIVSPGGAPTPPGRRLTRPTRRRRAGVEASPPSAPGPLGPHLRPAHPACSINTASPVDAPRRARRVKDKRGFGGGDKLFLQTY